MAQPPAPPPQSNKREYRHQSAGTSGARISNGPSRHPGGPPARPPPLPATSRRSVDHSDDTSNGLPTPPPSATRTRAPRPPVPPASDSASRPLPAPPGPPRMSQSSWAHSPRAGGPAPPTSPPVKPPMPQVPPPPITPPSRTRHSQAPPPPSYGRPALEDGAGARVAAPLVPNHAPPPLPTRGPGGQRGPGGPGAPPPPPPTRTVSNVPPPPPQRTVPVSGRGPASGTWGRSQAGGAPPPPPSRHSGGSYSIGMRVVMLFVKNILLEWRPAVHWFGPPVYLWCFNVLLVFIPIHRFGPLLLLHSSGISAWFSTGKKIILLGQFMWRRNAVGVGSRVPNDIQTCFTCRCRSFVGNIRKKEAGWCWGRATWMWKFYPMFECRDCFFGE